MENAKYYDQEDDFGEIGKPGMVREIVTGTSAEDMRGTANVEGISLSKYIGKWWNEVSCDGIYFEWIDESRTPKNEIGRSGNFRFFDAMDTLVIIQYPPRVHKRTRPASNTSNQIVGNIVKSVVRSVVSDRTNGTDKVCGLQFGIHQSGGKCSAKI